MGTREYQGVCPLCYKPVKEGEDFRKLGVENGRRETYHAGCLNDFVTGGSSEMERKQSRGLSLLEEYKSLIIGNSQEKREDWIAENKSEWQWTGEMFKTRREEYGISLKHIAEAMGVSVARVKRFEAGEPVRDAKLFSQGYTSLLYIFYLEQQVNTSHEQIKQNQVQLYEAINLYEQLQCDLNLPTVTDGIGY